MKKLLVFLTSFALLFTLVACDDSTTDGKDKGEDVATTLDEEVTIEFWHPFTGEIEAELARLTEEFNNSNELVTVELVYQGSYGDLEKKLLASQEAKGLPAMAVAYSTWDGLKDSYEDLNDYSDIEGYEMDFDGIVESFLDEVTKDDKVIGIPFNKSTEVVYYNKDLLEKAGFDPANPPKTYEEMFELAKKVKDTTGVTGIGFDSLSGYLTMSLAGNDLGWYDESSEEFNFANPEVVEDVTLYQDAINAGYARTAGEDKYMSGPFGSGSVAMYAGSIAGKTYVDSGVDGKFEWGAMTYPNNAVVQQGTNLTIFNTASAEDKLAAWQYISFLTQDQNVVDFSTVTGYLPSTYSAMNSADYQEYMENDEVAKAAFDEIDNITAGKPVSSGAGIIYGMINETMSAILDNKDDVQTSLEDLSAEAKNVYDRSE